VKYARIFLYRSDLFKVVYRLIGILQKYTRSVEKKNEVVSKIFETAPGDLTGNLTGDL
jgi:hypothetical protein